MSLVLGLGLEHSCPWPRECLSSERLSLASDFFCVFGLGLGLEPCVLDSTSDINNDFNKLNYVPLKINLDRLSCTVHVCVMLRFLIDTMATPIFCLECTKSVCGSDCLKCKSCRQNLHKACSLNNAITNHNEKKCLPSSSRQTQICLF